MPIYRLHDTRYTFHGEKFLKEGKLADPGQFLHMSAGFVGPLTKDQAKEFSSLLHEILNTLGMTGMVDSSDASKFVFYGNPVFDAIETARKFRILAESNGFVNFEYSVLETRYVDVVHLHGRALVVATIPHQHALMMK